MQIFIDILRSMKMHSVLCINARSGLGVFTDVVAVVPTVPVIPAEVKQLTTFRATLIVIAVIRLTNIPVTVGHIFRPITSDRSLVRPPCKVQPIWRIYTTSSNPRAYDIYN